MIEVLKQMVDALEWCYGGEPVNTADAIKAGKQLIAELESQEPVAWRDRAYGTLMHQEWQNADPLYAHPPQRKPLTDEEIQDVMTKAVQAKKVSWLGYKEDEGRRYTIPVLSPYHFQIARAIEAAHGIKGEE